MELRVLQYFLAVAREQSIVRAAESLQPLLLEQKTAIVLCKRPLFLSDLRAKCSLHFYRALSELFV